MRNQPIRVLCVNGDFTNVLFARDNFQKYVKEAPKENCEYTIKKQFVINGELGFELNELNNGFYPKSKMPVTFHHSRFVMLLPDAPRTPTIIETLLKIRQITLRWKHEAIFGRLSRN